MTCDKKIKVAVIGCTEFSAAALRALASNKNCHVVMVITRRRSSNSDFVDLADTIGERSFPHVHISGNDQVSMADAIKNSGPDVVFCVGWGYLLNSDILKIPEYGVVGYHPSLVPSNRGRHPLIWALALGLESTGSTFFLMDEGADSGKILSQKEIQIRPQDYARDLYDRMTSVALSQLDELLANWNNAYHSAKVQQGNGNTWRKRTKMDGKIDWRMSSKNILRLIRALSEPYPGAHFKYLGNEHVVWRAHEVIGVSSNFEPGKVLTVNQNSIIVKCGDNALSIKKEPTFPQLDVGDYL